jgi:hypothetical protein
MPNTSSFHDLLRLPNRRIRDPYVRLVWEGRSVRGVPIPIGTVYLPVSVSVLHISGLNDLCYRWYASNGGCRPPTKNQCD